MGEYVGISIGNYDFIGQKNTFGDLLSLFSSNELTIEDCIDEDGEKYERRYFAKTVRQAKRALDVMGHTLSQSQKLFEQELQTEIEYLRDDGDEEKINTLNTEFTFQLWVCAVKKYAAVVARDEYVDGHFPLLEKEQACNEAERKVYASLPFNKDETLFGIDLWYSDKTIGDYWDVFRVILEAFEDEEIVTLDYTNLYLGGWCNEYPEEDDYKASKTVVLTEGSTDARIIEAAINVLYPDLSKYYSFIDFSTYDVQGSTNYLSHYLKAFVATGIENRIIALYDNDSAGLAEIKNLEKMTFPDNVRIMHLPDLDFCVEYPTIGPSGNNNENINGRAGSIEMYVGKDILCNHGEYIPIRWKSYVDKVEAYQGEIISKSEVLKKFEEKAKKALKDGPILEEWNELDILLNAIFFGIFLKIMDEIYGSKKSLIDRMDVMNGDTVVKKKRRREVGESLIVGTVVSCVQNFIYDISVGACNGLIKKYKKKRFCKRVENNIRSFCIKNESLYFDSESFQNFITYHKPFDRVMENALSLGDAVDIDQLSNDIVAEAEDAAKTGGQILSIDDRRVFKDLLTLVSNEITSYYQDVLDDSQKYIVSQNAQNTKMLQREIKKVGDGNNQKIENVEKYLRDAMSISPYKAEPIAELICKKMWLGEFDEVETLCQVVSAKSDDLELAIRVLKVEMLENKHESDEIKQSISHIENIKIRNIVIRNIIPLIYFRKEKFNGMGELTDSEYLKAIMGALDNEDYSYLFSMETSVENGIEMRKYTLNKAVLNVEQWLVNQVFAIYMYNLKPVNTASLIENTIDARTSWFSALITYDKKVDLLAYEGLNAETHKELSELNELLDKKKSVYERLSDDLEAIFYALIIKISLIREERGDGVMNDIPARLHGLRPVKDFMLAGRIESGNISFEELYAFCTSVGEYWLLSDFFITLRSDDESLVNLVNAHKELLTKSETIFFIYVEALVHLGRAEDAKAYLLEYKTVYSKFFEFWNVYLNLDDSVKDDFLGLCKDNHIVYITGHSGCILVERLISFEEFDLAEFYNNQLQAQRINEKLSRKFKAFILNGKNKQINALECFKLAYEDFPKDLSIVNAILSISIQLKRRIELKYIRAAEESKNPKLLVLAGGAYATNGDYSEARRCNMRALFLSDDCRNPAFNQYLGLSMQDRQDNVPIIKSVEKNTSVVLQSEEHTLIYCVHGDMELPESPCIWHGDTHLYISDAANVGIYRRRVGDVVALNGTNYTVRSIEPIEAYISRICFESVVKNGSAKAITAPSVDGQIDVESFISQMKTFMPDDSERIDWIQQYNNFEDVALPLYMIKKPYNATYTQFVELIIEEPKSCVREMLNNKQPKNDRFVLSFTSMILLKSIGIGNEFLAENNVYVTESAMMQIVEDTSEMIAHYANDNVSSMGLYDGKPYIINTDENTKDKWIKEAGALRDYVEGIPSIVCKKDWNKSEFDQLKMTELLGTPDYDAISIGINDGYTVIGTEAMITGLAMNEEINVDVVSITNWLISSKIDVVKLIDIVKKLIAKGCIYSLTEQMVMYIIDAVKKSQDEEKREILTAWDSLFEVYNSADARYKAYGIEALRSTYVSVHESIEEPSQNPVTQIFIQRLLWLLKLQVTARFNENGELEIVYYQVQDESPS